MNHYIFPLCFDIDGINFETGKEQDLGTLFLKADNAVNRFKKAMITLNERIIQLETQNQTRKKTIDKLNKRIERRNDTIAKLKKQIPNNNDMTHGNPNFMPLASLEKQVSATSSNDINIHAHNPGTHNNHNVFARIYKKLFLR